MRTWSYYNNEFKTGVKEKALFKSFDYQYTFKGLTLLEISIAYRSNLRTNKDYREYDMGKKEINYSFDNLWLTLFSNKYYFLYVSWSYFHKAIEFFKPKYK